MVKVEHITSIPTFKLLEGPHWDVASQSLYFVDILEGLIFRYDYSADTCYQASIEGETDSKIGFIVPVEGRRDQFVIGCGPRLLLIQWDGKSTTAKRVKALVEVDQDVAVTRFNDGKCDPKGRIYAGTMMSEEHGDVFSARKGTFYRYNASTGTATSLKKNICIANGLAWNEKTNKFYYIDSGDYEIKEYDYAPTTGDLTNQQVLINFKPATFAPDGMTIDAQGHLYVATFNGGKILKINPHTKIIEQEILIPNVAQITSVAFGGPHLGELFVTTACLDGKSSPAGGMFKITGLGTTGTKMYNAKLD